jgi:large subunit ribosomal protein L13e
VERLQEYTKRVIVFPRKGGKTKQGDASAEDVKKARSGESTVASIKSSLPIINVPKVTEVKLADEKSEDAYKKLRLARSEARLIGVRQKRAKAKEDEEASKKK